MKPFRFKKTILRNGFTSIFGKVGQRRIVFISKNGKPNHYKRARMQMYRRAAQGWRNKVFGRLTAMKLRLQFGRRKPATRFRR